MELRFLASVLWVLLFEKGRGAFSQDVLMFIGMDLHNPLKYQRVE